MVFRTLCRVIIIIFKRVRRARGAQQVSGRLISSSLSPRTRGDRVERLPRVKPLTLWRRVPIRYLTVLANAFRKDWAPTRVVEILFERSFSGNTVTREFSASG